MKIVELITNESIFSFYSIPKYMTERNKVCIQSIYLFTYNFNDLIHFYIFVTILCYYLLSQIIYFYYFSSHSSIQ